MKTVLVSGGAGFIGSHLIEKLLSLGERVICVDNFLTGSYKNIEHLFQNPLFTFVEHDITLPLQLDGKVDQIYNLASPASPLRYQKIPIETLMINVLGTKNLLDLALKNNAEFLQASSSEVYGDPTVHPQKEEYNGNVNPIGIRACYDEGKRAAEALCFDYMRKFGLKIKVARIFNTYGPRMAINDGRVISNFIVRALQNKDLEIYGSGLQTRSFQYIDDLIEALIKMMNQSYPGPLNLGNPKEYTILEVANRIIELTGSKSSIIHLSPQEDDPQRRLPDIAKAKKILDWEPKFPLEEGLKRTIEFFRSILN
jgi:UDP-glucuronate decarboxylase